MRQFIFLSLLLLLATCILGDETALFNQCVTIATSKICIEATSVDCFELIGTVTYNKLAVTRKISIPTLLDKVQAEMKENGGQPTLDCQDADLPAGVPYKCSLCGSVTSLKLEEDDLHMCSAISINCTSSIAPPVTRHFEVPCIDIKSCRLFGCRNNCSGNGNCNSFGVCECTKGYFAPDCSMHVEQNCLKSSYWPQSCWSGQVSDCDNLAFKLDSTAKPLQEVKKISQLSALPLLQCQNFGNSTNCEMCVNAENLSIRENELVGCPKARVRCRNILVNTYNLDCMTLLKDDGLRCANINPQVPEEYSSTDGSTSGGVQPNDKTATKSNVMFLMLMGLAALALLVFVAVGTYMGVRWYRGRKEDHAVFERVANLDEDDLQPLQDDSDDSRSL